MQRWYRHVASTSEPHQLFEKLADGLRFNTDLARGRWNPSKRKLRLTLFKNGAFTTAWKISDVANAPLRRYSSNPGAQGLADVTNKTSPAGWYRHGVVFGGGARIELGYTALQAEHSRTSVQLRGHVFGPTGTPREHSGNMRAVSDGPSRCRTNVEELPALVNIC